MIVNVVIAIVFDATLIEVGVAFSVNIDFAAFVSDASEAAASWYYILYRIMELYLLHLLLH